MPKTTLSPLAGTDALIPDDLSRTHLEFSADADCRYCLGGVYVADDSQPLRAGDVRIYTTDACGCPFSFSNGKDTVVRYNEFPIP